MVMGGAAFAAAMRADFSPAIPGCPFGPGHCLGLPLWPAVYPQAFVSGLQPALLITFPPQLLEALRLDLRQLEMITASRKAFLESPVVLADLLGSP